jgi:hypothetical protein
LDIVIVVRNIQLYRQLYNNYATNMSQADLTERDWRVLQYIKENPNCSKENVVRGMKGDPSRITVINILTKLEQQQMIVARKEKPNSQIYKLFINEDNLLLSIVQGLDDLEKFFSNLLDEAKGKFGEKGSAEQQEHLSPNLFDLPTLILFLYRQVLGTYIVSCMFTWSDRIKDKETLNKLYSVVFLKIGEIQSKLSESFSSSDNNISKVQIFDSMSYNLLLLLPTHLNVIFKNFQMFGLTKQIEPILDSLWKTNSHFIPLALRSYSYPELQKLDNFKDWRKVVKVWDIIKEKHKLRYHLVI